MLTAILTEKEKHIKSSLCMMGLKPSMYWASWFLTFLIKILALSTIVGLMCHYGHILDNTSLPVLLGFLYAFRCYHCRLPCCQGGVLGLGCACFVACSLWMCLKDQRLYPMNLPPPYHPHRSLSGPFRSAAVIAYCLLFSAVFSRAKTGTVVALNVFWVLTIPGFAVANVASPMWLKVLTCFSPPGAFFLGTSMLVAAGALTAVLAHVRWGARLFWERVNRCLATVLDMVVLSLYCVLGAEGAPVVGGCGWCTVALQHDPLLDSWGTAVLEPVEYCCVCSTEANGNTINASSLTQHGANSLSLLSVIFFLLLDVVVYFLATWCVELCRVQWCGAVHRAVYAPQVPGQGRAVV